MKFLIRLSLCLSLSGVFNSLAFAEISVEGFIDSLSKMPNSKFKRDLILRWRVLSNNLDRTRINLEDTDHDTFSIKERREWLEKEQKRLTEKKRRIGKLREDLSSNKKELGYGVNSALGYLARLESRNLLDLVLVHQSGVDQKILEGIEKLTQNILAGTCSRVAECSAGDSSKAIDQSSRAFIKEFIDSVTDVHKSDGKNTL